jgi:hypothetical protein
MSRLCHHCDTASHYSVNCPSIEKAKVCKVCCSLSWRVVGPRCKHCGLLYAAEAPVELDVHSRRPFAFGRIGCCPTSPAHSSQPRFSPRFGSARPWDSATGSFKGGNPGRSDVMRHKLAPIAKCALRDRTNIDFSADWLCRSREVLCLTGEQMARAVGASVRAWWSYERGEKVAPITLYWAVRRLLDERNLDSNGRMKLA